MATDACDGPPVDERGESLARRFEREGIDLKYLEEPFLESSEIGDAATVRQRLAGWSPDEVRRFLRQVDQQGRTGLLLAVARGDAAVAEVLLDSGANPNEADSSGSTALHYCAGRSRSVDAMELLLRCKADVDRKDDEGQTPLMWASCPRAIDALLLGRADATIRDSRGRSALSLAADRGNLEVLELLAMQPGCDLESMDAAGHTAYRRAWAAGHAEACELLARCGAAASVPADGGSDSPLAAGARLERGDEALLDAARRGDAEAIESLVRGAAVDVNTELGGETALLLAAGAGAGRAVEVLLEARADPNQADSYLRESPLLRAILGGACTPELLWLLLEARADPKQGDLTGRTACDVATSWGDVTATELLRAAADGALGFEAMD